MGGQEKASEKAPKKAPKRERESIEIKRMGRTRRKAIREAMAFVKNAGKKAEKIPEIKSKNQVLKRDANLYSEKGYGIKVAFKGEKAKVLDTRIYKIKGVDHVKVEVDHEYMKYRGKPGEYRSFIGYVEKSDIDPVGDDFLKELNLKSAPVVKEPVKEPAKEPAKEPELKGEWPEMADLFLKSDEFEEAGISILRKEESGETIFGGKTIPCDYRLTINEVYYFAKLNAKDKTMTLRTVIVPSAGEGFNTEVIVLKEAEIDFAKRNKLIADLKSLPELRKLKKEEILKKSK